MSDLPIPSSSSPVQGQGHPAGASAAKKAPADGAHAFKALLEQLEDRTKALEQQSRKELSKDDLAGAVDEARASLEQMLSLKDQLLEAWRASQQSGEGSEKA